MGGKPACADASVVMLDAVRPLNVWDN